MAAFATARPSLSFHLQPPSSPPRPSRTTLPLHFTALQTPRRKMSLSRHFNPLASVEVSKEDKPLSEQEQEAPAAFTQMDEAGKTPEVAAEAEGPGEGEGEEMDMFQKRRLEERFAVLNTGIYECRSCGYRYDQAVGDPSYPIPPGLNFEKLPEDWRCPTCGAAKSFFQSKSVEIAGFAQNQQFGLGGNSLTSGQKAALIYGTLLFFFALFLSGYFLQ